LYKKAEAALLAAIELYNKPEFRYREEAFAILALNAWELLLKAKLVAESGNQARALYSYERRPTKKGVPSKKLYVRRNRTGNVHTIGLGQVIAELENSRGIRLARAVRDNLNGLTEIRDNAVHYINPGPHLSKQVLELGTASIKNFIELSKVWFQMDLSSYNLYLMPIGFVGAPGVGTAISTTPDEERLVQYLATLVRDSADHQNMGFHVALEVNLSFKRSTANGTAHVVVTKDPNATKVVLTDEEIRKIYPWDYAELTRRLANRYIDFRANQKYHDIRKPLKTDPKFVRVRFLDPGNPRSAKKEFYNPNIVAEFDKHYTRKS